MDIEKINEEIREISKEYYSSGAYKEMSEPKFIVEKSRPKDSPLHEYFDWDNKKAGEKWRVQQARHLIIRVRVYSSPNAGKEINTRAFFSIRKEHEINGEMQQYRIYEHIDDILADKELSKEVLKQALSDLRSWVNRYRNLEELIKITKMADQILLEFEDIKV